MRLPSLFVLSLLAQALMAQITVTPLPQHHFPHAIPAGNYSGIAWLGGDRYAVVSDKSAGDGFFEWEIKLDSLTGEVTSARDLGFHVSGFAGRDDEGIAYNPHTGRIFISGEADNRIRECALDGKRTGRTVPLAAYYRRLPPNLGLEALSYNAKTRQLWTCNEADTIFLTSYDDDLRLVDSCFYRLDAPEGDKSQAQFYAHGVGALTALDDGSLLLLEREFWTPKRKLGAFVQCKLYRLAIQGGDATAGMRRFACQPSQKTLLATWRTNLTLFGRDIANYEGMCLGPTLSDGARVLILVADSQNQYAGVLRDWIKSIKIEGL